MHDRHVDHRIPSHQPYHVIEVDSGVAVWRDQIHSVTTGEGAVGHHETSVLITSEVVGRGGFVPHDEGGARVGRHGLEARVNRDVVVMVGRNDGCRDRETLGKAPLGVCTESFAILAIHEHVAAALQFIQYSKFNINQGATRTTAGAKDHVVTVAHEGVDHFSKTCRRPSEPLATRLFAGDVLEVARVSLRADESQSSTVSHAISEAACVVYVCDARSSHAEIDVTKYRDPEVVRRGVDEFVDSFE